MEVSFHMSMGEKVILTILIIAVALGTVSELQIRIIKLCAPAYSAPVLRASSIRNIPARGLPNILLKLMLALHLLRRIRPHIP